MSQEVWTLIKGLAAGVLVPVLLANLLSTPRMRRLGGVGRALLFGLMSCLGAIVTSGLGVPGDSPMILQLISAARAHPPETLQRELPPRLTEMLNALSMRAGQPLPPEELHRRVSRMMDLLMAIRNIPDEQFGPQAPQFVARFMQEAGGGALLAGLVWSPYTDDTLVVVAAAGLTGGIAVGLASALLGVAFRFFSAGIPPPFLVPTLAVGLLGGIAGRRATLDCPSAAIATGRAAFATGVLAGALQIAWVLFISPVGYLSPGVLAGSATLLAIHGTGLGLFAVATRMQRLEEQERAAREAQVGARLALLTAQVRPHFLFNALNTIAAASATDPERTRRLIGCLADFLRLSLRPGSGLVMVSEEMAHLAPYLELERARYPDRLRLRVDVVEPAGAARMPSLLLQPLVENAVAHGLRPGGEPLEVVVRAALCDDRLHLSVEDDGAGASPMRLAELSRGQGLGIGLASVRERVRAMAVPGTFRVSGAPDRGFKVEVELALV